MRVYNIKCVCVSCLILCTNYTSSPKAFFTRVIRIYVLRNWFRFKPKTVHFRPERAAGTSTGTDVLHNISTRLRGSSRVRAADDRARHASRGSRRIPDRLTKSAGRAAIADDRMTWRAALVCARLLIIDATIEERFMGLSLLLSYCHAHGAASTAFNLTLAGAPRGQPSSRWKCADAIIPVD